MNSKISFFNKSIIKSDFKRLWWIAALETLAILTFYTFTYIYSMIALPKQGFNITYNNARFVTSGLVMHGGYWLMAAACIFPVVAGVLLFSYLNSSKAVSCMHGLPIKRRTFFASHVLSGVCLAVLPIIVNMLVLLLFRFNPDVAKSYRVVHLFMLTGEFIIYSLLALSGTVAVLMLTGNSVAAIVFTYIFAALPAAAEDFIEIFCEMNLYGYISNRDYTIANFLYITPNKLLWPGNVIKYIVFILVLTAAAFWLYKIRKLENNGEVVAFPKLRPIFIYGVAICAGSAGYMYLSEILNLHNILLLIPFGVLGMIAAEMIVTKSLKIKGTLKPALVFCICVAVLQFAFQADILGYERRVPSLAKIDSVVFNFDNINDREQYYTSNGRAVKYENDDKITSVQTIEAITKFHKEVVDSRNEKAEERLHPMHVTLKYNLKNGKTISRTYTADYDKYKDTITPIVSSEEVRKQFYPILRDYDRKIGSIRIEDIRGGVVSEIASPELTDEIIEALKKDAAAVPCDEFILRTDSFTSIIINYKRPGNYSDGTPIPEELLPNITESYYVRNSFENVRRILNDRGFYDSIQKQEDITAIGINYYGDTRYIEEYVRSKEQVMYDEYVFDRVIEDRTAIDEVYKYISENVRADYRNAEVRIFYKDGYSFTMDFGSDSTDLPEVMKP